MDKIAILKKDVLNKLETEKYYVVSELNRISFSTDISRKDQVDMVSELIGELATINSKQVLVNNLFVESQPNVETKQTSNDVDNIEPSNVIES